MLVIYNVEEATPDGLLDAIRVGSSHPNTSQVIRKVELLTSLTSGEGLRVSTELKPSSESLLWGNHHLKHSHHTLSATGSKLHRLTSFIKSRIYHLYTSSYTL